MLTMSITQPRKTWKVYHVQSPALSLFRDNTYLLLAYYPESQGQNTFSRE